MTKDYKKITEMLFSNTNHSFELRRLDGQYGVNFIRSASIWEPNPFEGEVANPGSGLDQQFLEDARRKKSGFHFNAKTSKQAINLLELASNGIEGLKDTTKSSFCYDFGRANCPVVHGFSKPQGGLDNWIFANFELKLYQKEDALLAEMSVYKATFDKEVIYSQKVNGVGEAIEIYNEVPVNMQTLNNLRVGLRLDENIKDHFLGKPQHNFFERSKNMVGDELVQLYDSQLQELKSFKISQTHKNAIFLATILNNCYSK